MSLGPKSQHGRIAPLDGWRGVAIVMVLIEHLNLSHGRLPASWIQSVGQHGVTIFFVLSGYLITGKLLEPNSSLRQFYLRRFFRLSPVAWTFLLLTWAIGYLSHVQMIWPMDVLACVLFVRNYAGEIGRSSTLHFWSLSIEEQFYFVWPAALLLLGERRARWLAVGAALAAYGLLLTDPGHNFIGTEIRADALFVGCFLALILQTDVAKRRFVAIAKWVAGPSILVVTYHICRGDVVPTLPECIGLGFLIASSSLGPWLKMLAWKPLTWLGRISYSVYIWNTLVLTLFVDSLKPVLFALLIIIPSISYYYIELPAQRFGARLLHRH